MGAERYEATCPHSTHLEARVGNPSLSYAVVGVKRIKKQETIHDNPSPLF